MQQKFLYPNVKKYFYSTKYRYQEFIGRGYHIIKYEINE